MTACSGEHSSSSAANSRALWQNGKWTVNSCHTFRVPCIHSSSPFQNEEPGKAPATESRESIDETGLRPSSSSNSKHPTSTLQNQSNIPDPSENKTINSPVINVNVILLHSKSSHLLQRLLGSSNDLRRLGNDLSASRNSLNPDENEPATTSDATDGRKRSAARSSAGPRFLAVPGNVDLNSAPSSSTVTRAARRWSGQGRFDEQNAVGSGTFGSTQHALAGGVFGSASSRNALPVFTFSSSDQLATVHEGSSPDREEEEDGNADEIGEQFAAEFSHNLQQKMC